MKLLQIIRDGGMYAGYLAFLLAIVVLGAHGLAVVFG